MTRRRSHAALDAWVVIGTVVASTGHAVLRFQQPTLSERLGLGYPLLSLVVLWALVLGVQAVCWRIWAVLRVARLRKKRASRPYLLGSQGVAKA